MRDRRDLRNIENIHARIGDRFAIEHARIRPDGFTEILRIVGLDEGRLDSQPAKRNRELRNRPAIQGCGRHHMIARLHQAGEREELRRLPAGSGQRRHAAFERCHALLEDIGRGVHDARVNIAELLQPEQGGGMIGILEDERRRLIDRHGACAGRRIGLLPRMQ